MAALRFMCGHVNPMYIADIPPHVAPLVYSWFPLPLFCPHTDAV